MGEIEPDSAGTHLCSDDMPPVPDLGCRVVFIGRGSKSLAYYALLLGAGLTSPLYQVVAPPPPPPQVPDPGLEITGWAIDEARELYHRPLSLYDEARELYYRRLSLYDIIERDGQLLSAMWALQEPAAAQLSIPPLELEQLRVKFGYEQMGTVKVPELIPFRGYMKNRKRWK